MENGQVMAAAALNGKDEARDPEAARLAEKTRRLYLQHLEEAKANIKHLEDENKELEARLHAVCTTDSEATVKLENREMRAKLIALRRPDPALQAALARIDELQARLKSNETLMFLLERMFDRINEIKTTLDRAIGKDCAGPLFASDLVDAVTGLAKRIELIDHKVVAGFENSGPATASQPAKRRPKKAPPPRKKR